MLNNKKQLILLGILLTTIFIAIFLFSIQTNQKKIVSTKAAKIKEEKKIERIECANSCNNVDSLPKGGCPCNNSGPFCPPGFLCLLNENPVLCQPIGLNPCPIVSDNNNEGKIIDETVQTCDDNNLCLPKYLMIAKKILDSPPVILGTAEEFYQGVKKGIGYATFWGYEESHGVSNTAYRGYILREQMIRGKIHFDISNNYIMNQNGVILYEDLFPHLQYLFNITKDCPTPEDVTITNIKDNDQLKKLITSNCKKGIRKTYITDQSKTTPLEGLRSGIISGYIATRSPMDIGKRYVVYTIDSPGNVESMKFLGIALSIDSAALINWLGIDGYEDRKLSTQTYNYKGWDRLHWVIDASKNLFTRFPSGISNDQNNLNEGRPGVVIIDEYEYVKEINNK